MTYNAAQSKRQRIARERGVPSLMRGEEVRALRARLQGFRDRGMSLDAMEAQSGVTYTGVSNLLNRDGDRMLRSTYQKLLRVRFCEGEGLGAQVSPVGAVRRLRALWADGWPIPYLASQLDMGKRNVQTFANVPRNYIFAATDRKVRALYDKLDGVDPEDVVTLREVRYARTFAKKRGYAPRGCWDSDTIDDPAAFPEWTGHCGTSRGAWIHRRDSIPVCDQCRGLEAEERAFSPEKYVALRLSKGLSQGQVEELAGLGKGQSHHWESGRNVPRLKNLERVLSALDITYEDISE